MFNLVQLTQRRVLAIHVSRQLHAKMIVVILMLVTCAIAHWATKEKTAIWNKVRYKSHQTEIINLYPNDEHKITK